MALLTNSRLQRLYIPLSLIFGLIGEMIRNTAVRSVEMRGGAYDPRAVCGAMEKRYRNK